MLVSCHGAFAEPAPEMTFNDYLAELPGVTSVAVIEQNVPAFAEKYLVTFTQPIDWEHPELGSFEQRVKIGYNSQDAVNVFRVGGYVLFDELFAVDEPYDLTRVLNGCNVIDVEYRFFGASSPEGLSVDSAEWWEYLTDKNASADFHAVMEAMKTLLTGDWYFTGESKGGQETNVYAYYYLEDCAAYVAYVAPFANGLADPALVKAAFTTLGDNRFDPEQAAVYRDILMTAIVDLVEYRDAIQPYYLFETMEEDILWNMMFTEEQKAAFTYDPSLREAILSWENTTEQNVIMIFGETDPWTAVGLPETDNPHMARFVVPDQAHSAGFLSMPEEMAAEALQHLLP